MKQYTTKSGSIYQVDGTRVRRLVRSAKSHSERVAEEWREAIRVTCKGEGSPLVIFWGVDPDEHSGAAIQVDMGGDTVIRSTVTTPVTNISEVN